MGPAKAETAETAANDNAAQNETFKHSIKNSLSVI
jgi:hypothetical protein